MPNLLLLLCSQYLLRYALLEPQGLSLVQSHFEFACMCLATVYVAAGGYVINDIYDVAIDRINKPKKVWLDQLSESWAWGLYAALNAVALLLVGLSGHIVLIVIHVAAMFGLYAYARWLKCRPLFGNILVATFCALVPLEVVLLEWNFLTATQQLPWLFYMSFAWGSNLWRELVKDLEDQAGDAAQRCRTLAVRSVTRTKQVAAMIILGLGAGALYCSLEMQMLAAGTCFLILPLLGLSIRFFMAQNRKNYHQVSTGLKWWMLVGLSFVFLF